MTDKPKCKLIGTDGNVFALMGNAARTLKLAGEREKAEEMRTRIMAFSTSYDEALKIIGDYVEIV